MIRVLKKTLLYLKFGFIFSFLSARVFAQVPTISYATPQVYTIGNAISTLSPTSTGVAAIGTFGAGTSFGSGYSGPQDLTFDNSGNFYVADQSGNNIRKFNSSGTFIATFGTGLNSPNSISFDALGNAYIINAGTSSVIKVTSGGVQSTFVTGLSNPYGGTVDAAGNVYVANYGANNVKEYNGSGTLLQTISNTTAINVAVDASGNIYVLSYSAGTVNKYNAAGVLQSTLTPNVASLGLITPFGISVDASGNIYIADSGNNRILEYNSSYTLLGTISTGLLTAPRSTAIDASGNLYVNLFSTNTVNKYAPTGGYFISQAVPAGLSFNNNTGSITGTPTAITAATNYIVTAYNSTGSASATLNIMVTNPPVPTISYTTPQMYTAGTVISTLSPVSTNVNALGNYGAGAAFGTGNSGPQDIAFDAAGNLYVTELTSNTIRKYSSTGTYLTTLGSSLSNIYSIAFDALTNAYIISGGKIIKVTSGGTQTTFIPSGLSTPRGIATDASGNIYVANNGSGAIQKYNNAGLLISTIAAPAGLYDITLDASGNIYALSNTGGTVTIYNPAGVLQSTLTPNVAGLNLNGANGVFVDASGNLYISDAGNNRILQYQGTTLVANTATGTGTSPRSVTVDASGNIYATLNTTSVVNKYAPTGGYFISQPLPAGLNFDNIAGNITGTPTVASASTNYTVTGYNGINSASCIVNITVNPALGISRCGAGSVVLTASPGSPAGGTYKWYTSNTALTPVQTSTSATYSPSLVTTTTYYVSYTTGGVESGRTAITAVINPIVSASYTGAYYSYPFSGNSNDVSGNNNNGVLTATPTLTADRYGATNNAYTFDGATQYISTTTSATSPTTFTISLWFNTTTAGGKLIGFGNAQTGASATYDRHLYMTSTGQLSFGLYDTGFDYITTTNTYNDGNWHHVIVTVGATGSFLYVDGALQISKGTMIPSVNYSGYWRMGYDAISTSFYPNATSNAYFTGTLDDIAVYNTVFTAAQITSSNDLNQIGVSVNSLCPGSPVSFTAPTIIGATYTWKDAANNIQSGQNVTFSSATAGNYYLTVSGGPGGCGSSAIINGLTVNPVFSSPISGATFSYSFSGNANDVSGNANNGVVSGATLTADRNSAASSAYSLNGSSNYITTSTLITNPTVFTMNLWFKTTTTSGGLLMGLGNTQTGSSSNYDRVLYMNNAGQLYFGVNANGVQTINSSASYNDGKWHHAVVTFGTDGSTLYVDDYVQAANSAMTVAQNFNGYWRIGYNNLTSWTSQPSSFFFNGTLDDVAVYSRELSAAEIGTTNNLNQIGALTKPICSGSPITLSAPLLTGATYTWKDASGTTMTGVNLNNPTFASAVSGNYTLTVTGGPGGCSSSATVTPTITPIPATTFSATPYVDINTNATITLNTYVATSTYTWDFNGGTPSTATGQGPFTVQWSTPGTKTITLTVTNSSGCFSSGTQTVNVSNTSYGNYAFRRTVTLNTTSAAITSNLTSFPVLLSIQNNDLIITGTCTDKVYIPNGPNYDFAFVDPSSSTELYYQVESYNQTTGTLLVWVQLPSVNYAANNTISFYYGSTAPTVTHNSAFFQKTWTSDYQAVFHFNDASFTGTTSDGTSNGHVASLGGFATTDLVPGKIGSAYNFGGNNNMTTTPVNVSVAFTISAWINLNTLNLDQKVMTTENASGLSSGGFKLGVFTTNIPETEDGGDYDRGYTPNPTACTTGTWYYVQGVYDGTTLSTYVNGVQYKMEASTKNVTLLNTLYIGVGEGGLYPFNGVIDEPRVSSVAKTSDWLKMEYVDQNNPVAFTTTSATRATNLTTAAVLPGALTYTWTGATSTDPTVASNWTNTTTGISNQLPLFNGSPALVIPAGLSSYPVLTADAGVYGLTIANGASINLNGHILSVGCNIYNSSGGQIIYGTNNTSGINWNGSLAAQTYTGTNTTNTAQIGSMTINNSAGGTVTISGGPVDIYNSLTLTKGNLVIASAPAALTLKSTATTTAGVGAIPTGSAITGTVNVERYLTANNRGYRLLSSPVYSSSVSGNNVYSINYLKNYMYLTSTSILGGFDNILPANPSLYLYRENMTPAYSTFLNSNFRGINNMLSAPSYTMDDATYPTANIPVGNGFLCFFRGNRLSATFALETLVGYVPQSATTVTSGTLNQGQIIVRDWFTPASSNLSYTSASPATVMGYNLVGNPYASAIDWETFQSSSITTGIYGTGVGSSIYVLNPATHNYGAYIKGAGGIGTNSATNVISSGQGFFVTATSTSAQVIFNESAKTSAQVTGSQLLMGQPVNYAVSQYLRLLLSKDSVNTDDMIIRFSDTVSTQKFVESIDAAYKPGFGAVSLSSVSSDHINLAINSISLPQQQKKTIALNVTTNNDGIYSISLSDLVAVPRLYEVWLMDAYKRDSLDMRQNKTYSFNIIKSDTSSYGNKRFSLVIRQNPAFAYRLLNFTANKIAGVNRQVQVNWKTENEQNYTNFTVERSVDGGKTFSVVGSVASNDAGTYGFLDINPVAGQNMYRLKQEDLNNSISYSKVITIQYTIMSDNLVKGNISVYPNPTSSNINLNISPDVSTANSFKITVTTSSGIILKQATSNQANWQANMSDLEPGTYIINVHNGKDNSFIGNTKFVKL